MARVCKIIKEMIFLNFRFLTKQCGFFIQYYEKAFIKFEKYVNFNKERITEYD
jgi:hypothetical protein